MNKTNQNNTSSVLSAGLVPKLRFPEFSNHGDWINGPLNSIAKLIDVRAGTNEYISMSVTPGVGLISQKEKFGREISGAQYKNYYVIKRWDFAYNKSATKLYPEGYITILKDVDEAAVPNSIFTCFRTNQDKIYPPFLDYLFHDNFHGRWLRKFIEIGGRAHGLISIAPDILMKMPIVYPKLNEQQKIADCLSSLDDLITAENQKLDALIAHKKGLMQNLFPAEGEKVPKLRFKEFENSGEWDEETIKEIAQVSTGGTPESTNPEYWNGEIPWMNSGELNNKRIYSVSNSITQKGLKESSTKRIPPYCVLIGLAGQGKTRGTAAINYIELCTNQSIAAIHPNKDIFCSEFLYHKIDSMYEQLRALSAGEGGRGGLNLQIIKAIELQIPSIVEQQKIADCLSSLDDLIIAQSQKIESLKEHKKGLMQGLFPNFNSVNV